jgi:hypothetical protein
MTTVAGVVKKVDTFPFVLLLLIKIDRHNQTTNNLCVHSLNTAAAEIPSSFICQSIFT